MPIAKTNPATQTAARTIGNPSLDATLWVWGIEPVGAAVGAADPIAGLSTTATDVTWSPAAFRSDLNDGESTYELSSATAVLTAVASAT